jgi:hypothetical protein
VYSVHDVGGSVRVDDTHDLNRTAAHFNHVGARRGEAVEGMLEELVRGAVVLGRSSGGAWTNVLDERLVCY